MNLHRLLPQLAAVLIPSLALFHPATVSDPQLRTVTPPPIASKRPFRMLVLGDSVMWGQGLTNDNKFSYRLKNWICRQRNSGTCPTADDVEIYVEAHSGAVVAQPRKPHEKEIEQRFLRTNAPVRFDGEVNFGYPTIWGEVDLARRHYEAAAIAREEIDLIIVNGGINDIGAPNILLPLLGGNLDKLARKYSEQEMRLLLDKLADTFPNARIIVPGYFPLVSVCTPENIILETVGYFFLHQKERANSEIAKDPAPPRCDVNARVSHILKSLANRSVQWTAASNASLAAAVASFNSAHSTLPVSTSNGQTGPPAASMRALFIAIPFKEENAYAASNSFLWKLVPKPANTVFECAEHDPLKKLMVNDEIQSKRPCKCDQAGKGNDIACVRAATFHPNIQGAGAYYDAISSQLEKIWPFTSWAAGN